MPNPGGAGPSVADDGPMRVNELGASRPSADRTVRRNGPPIARVAQRKCGAPRPARMSISPVLNQSAESAAPPCSNVTGAEVPKPTSMTDPPLETSRLGVPVVDDEGVEVKLEP